MENQFLQWEKDQLSKRTTELEAVVEELQRKVREVSPREVDPNMPEKGRRVISEADSKIEFKLPEETSDYVSYGARPLSSIGESPELVPKRKEKGPSYGEVYSLKPSRQRENTEVSTPVSAAQGVDRASSKLPDEPRLSLKQGHLGSPNGDPFEVSPLPIRAQREHSEVMSFATRPPCSSKEVAVEVDSSAVGPWPLKRESRMFGDEVYGKPQVRMPRRPNIVPDRYDGKLVWNEYFQHFESCREVNEWSDEQAAKYLVASLQGSALRLLGDRTPEGHKHTYSELVKLLAQRFGPGRQAENYLVMLRHRRQKPKETLQELGQAIRELAVKAYPEIQEKARERLAKNHFLEAVESPTVREGIYRARPTDLDEAIRAALETENFDKVEQQTG